MTPYQNNKNTSVVCPICKLPLEVIVRAYQDQPFIDGRLYREICHRCSNVPKYVSYDKRTGEWIIHDHASTDRIATVQELIEDGWEKHEAESSIRAIKRLLHNPKTILIPENGIHIFDKLFLRVEL